MGGRPQGSPLRKRYKGGRGERNPPVTASPCQPPLGKGDDIVGLVERADVGIGPYGAFTDRTS